MKPTRTVPWFTDPPRARTRARAGIGRSALLLAAGLAPPAFAEPPYQLTWGIQFGSPGEDLGRGVAVDSAGNAFTTGWTMGSLFAPSAGGYDMFLVAHDAAGTMLWSRQSGTSYSDWGNGVALDNVGDIRVTGAVGEVTLAGVDAWLARYSPAGTLLWQRQFGSIPTMAEAGSAIATDPQGNSYIAGTCSTALFGPAAGGTDVFLARHDSSGTLVWGRQFGSPLTDGLRLSIAIDEAGGVYVAGETNGTLFAPGAGGTDAFVVKYDASGSLLWSRQFGTSTDDMASGVAVDGAGHVYVTGDTGGSLFGPGAGSRDVFLAKFDLSGNVVWARQYGSSGWERAEAIAVDGSGNVLVTGAALHSWFAPLAGPSDAVLVKFDPLGNLKWGRQFGSANGDWGRRIAVRGAGDLRVVGETFGSLFGPIAGNNDVWLARFDPGCYPDCNGDGSLNLADFGCFQTKFALQDPFADCNGDGALNLADFGCFQTRFALGCP